MDTHGSILDDAVTCCQFGYPVNDRRDVCGPVQLDLRKAVLVCLHHSLDLWSEGKDGRDTVNCSDRPLPARYWQHLSDNLGLASVRFLRPKKKSEWLHHLFYVHVHASRKLLNLAQISIINNHVRRLGLTFAFIVLRVEIYGKVMRNLQTGEGMSRLGSTAAKHEWTHENG